MTVASEIWSELGREERTEKGKNVAMQVGVRKGGAGETTRANRRVLVSSRRALHRVRRISRDRTMREEIYASEKSVGWKEAFSTEVT